MELKDKIVLITGAARRLGREMAHGFADQGAHVLVHYRSSVDDAESLVSELQQKKVRSQAYQADLSSVASVQAMAIKIMEEHQQVNVLVNNASSFYATPFKTTTEAQWDEFLAIHVKAPFFLVQQLATAMKRTREARIINMADWTGEQPRKNYAAYCTSKAALLSLTQVMAKELAPEILVNAVCPGPILPPLGMDEDEKAEVAATTLIKRWGSPADIVKQVLFLAEQDYATGQVYYVDGGQSLA